MNIIIAIICVFGSVATIMFLSTLSMGSWFKAAIIVPVVLLAVYSMARIPPKEPEAEKIPEKSKSPISSQSSQSAEQQAL